MEKELLERFLKDFHIVTQDEDEEFPYANPSDAARSLIKARNWIGTLTEKLMAHNDLLKETKRRLNRAEHGLAKVERKILAGCSPVPSWATKNKEIQKSYLLANATETEKSFIEEFEKTILEDREQVSVLETEISQYDSLVKSLDKTTEWVIQYINWMKYEARNLNA